MTRVLICEICGYQWDSDEKLFFAECPICESQMVHEMRKPNEPQPDEKPWH